MFVNGYLFHLSLGKFSVTEDQMLSKFIFGFLIILFLYFWFLLGGGGCTTSGECPLDHKELENSGIKTRLLPHERRWINLDGLVIYMCEVSTIGLIYQAFLQAALYFC